MIKFRNVAALLALSGVAALPACSMFGGNNSSHQSSAPASQPPVVSQAMVQQVQTRLQQAGTYSGRIDYAMARRHEEPISTAVTESTMQWLVHRRMNAQQQMRWTPRGAHLILKVRCAVMNGTLQHDHVVAEGRARRPFRRAA